MSAYLPTAAEDPQDACSCGHPRRLHRGREGCVHVFRPGFRFCDCSKFTPAPVGTVEPEYRALGKDDRLQDGDWSRLRAASTDGPWYKLSSEYAGRSVADYLFHEFRRSISAQPPESPRPASQLARATALARELNILAVQLHGEATGAAKIVLSRCVMSTGEAAYALEILRDEREAAKE